MKNPTEYTVKTEIKNISTIKNIRLEGLTIVVDKVTVSYEYTRRYRLNSARPIKLLSKKLIEGTETIESITIQLVEISPETLAMYRRLNEPSFVLKRNGKLFCAPVKKDMNFMYADILGSHMCGVCSHLSAASDEKSGCEKVRDRAQRIERYPWITLGYETFGTKYDCFAVVTCLNFEK